MEFREKAADRIQQQSLMEKIRGATGEVDDSEESSTEVFLLINLKIYILGISRSRNS